MKDRNFSSCLRQEIVIEQEKFDNLGEQKYFEHSRLRAEVTPLYELKIGEVFSSMQWMDNNFYRFRIRFVENLQNNMRISYKNKFFLIKRIINQGELNKTLLILAQEINI